LPDSLEIYLMSAKYSSWRIFRKESALFHRGINPAQHVL
jgi:hypothetical protein